MGTRSPAAEKKAHAAVAGSRNRNQVTASITNLMPNEAVALSSKQVVPEKCLNSHEKIELFFKTATGHVQEICGMTPEPPPRNVAVSQRKSRINTVVTWVCL